MSQKETVFEPSFTKLIVTTKSRFIGRSNFI